MKIRDSGMPEAAVWNTFFDPAAVLRALGLHHSNGPVVDVGCGYGTFTLPAAQLTGRKVIALDVESRMVQQVSEQARRLGISHLVKARQQDVAAKGTGLENQGTAIVLLFNILHCEEPLDLLREANRILAPGGRVGIIHWRSDVPTPRGPDLSIRPTPAICQQWLEEAEFGIDRPPVALPPYHFGLVGIKHPIKH